jgi:hypothetical protein
MPMPDCDRWFACHSALLTALHTLHVDDVSASLARTLVQLPRLVVVRCGYAPTLTYWEVARRAAEAIDSDANKQRAEA